METKRIALIGCGRWGRYILRDLINIGCTVPVVEISEQGRKNAVQGNAQCVLASVQELTGEDPVDGIVIAVTTRAHFEVIQQCRSYFPQIPIFCEKPLTVNSAECLQLQQDSAPIFVMDKWRYHTGILTLAQTVRSGIYGDILGIRTERLGWGIPHLDVNPVWILMPHDLSIVYEILGTLPSVMYAHCHRIGEQIVGMDAILKENISLRVSIASPVRRRCVEVLCERGVLSFSDDANGEISIATGPFLEGDREPERRRISYEDSMPLFSELEAFVRYLSGQGDPPRSSLAEGALAISRIEEMFRLSE